MRNRNHQVVEEIVLPTPDDSPGATFSARVCLEGVENHRMYAITRVVAEGDGQNLLIGLSPADAIRQIANLQRQLQIAADYFRAME